jgi:hypothetical protein
VRGSYKGATTIYTYIYITDCIVCGFGCYNIGPFVHGCYNIGPLVHGIIRSL